MYKLLLSLLLCQFTFNFCMESESNSCGQSAEKFALRLAEKLAERLANPNKGLASVSYRESLEQESYTIRYENRHSLTSVHMKDKNFYFVTTNDGRIISSNKESHEKFKDNYFWWK